MRPFEHIFKEIDKDRGLLYAWFAAMHSRVDIVICDKCENDMLAVTGKIYERIAQLEKLANFYNPHSELTKLNEVPAGVQTEVGEELLSMLYLSMRYNELTDGRFDVCVKSDGYTGGMRGNVEIDLEGGTVTKQRYGIRFDLSGFLKGYALDQARNILTGYAVSDVLLSIGNSSVLALGNHPFGDGWRVSYPESDDSNIEIDLHDECLTTSGNANSERRHIVNPVSGALIEGEGRISVVTRGGAEGEALSTAMFVERGAGEREAILGRFRRARLLDTMN